MHKKIIFYIFKLCGNNLLVCKKASLTVTTNKLLTHSFGHVESFLSFLIEYAFQTSNVVKNMTEIPMHLPFTIFVIVR